MILFSNNRISDGHRSKKQNNLKLKRIYKIFTCGGRYVLVTRKFEDGTTAKMLVVIMKIMNMPPFISETYNLTDEDGVIIMTD